MKSNNIKIFNINDPIVFEIVVYDIDYILKYVKYSKI